MPDAEKKEHDLIATSDEKLKRIQGKQDWQTFTPASQQATFAESELLRKLAETGQWELVYESWRSRFLPIHEIVQEVSSGLLFLVLNVYNCGTQAWPMAQVGPKIFKPNLGVTSLRWLTCLQWTDFVVMPSRPVSPLHLWVEGKRDHMGVMVEATGPHMPVLDWQIEHGFPSIPEGSLKKSAPDLRSDSPDETQCMDFLHIHMTSGIDTFVCLRSWGKEGRYDRKTQHRARKLLV